MSPSAVAVAAIFAVRALAGGLNVPLPPSSNFDYVVIGGGPSGLTVANRLTEDPSVTVLLLEAGHPDQGEQRITVPAFQGSAGFFFGSCGGYNWCDQTVAQEYLQGRRVTIPQGKGLGGGTLINAMLWNRGDTQDYDDWAALGNEGWDFATYGIGQDSSVHGFSGPQNVTFPRFKYTPSQNFFAAMNGLGIPTQLDPANPPEKGAMWLPQGLSPWNQSRADARRARWDTVQDRPNFWISTNQNVHRILFEEGCTGPRNGARARAIGVESSQGDGQYTWVATANREVILSAGSVRTPQTLELSGIGDTNVLTNLGMSTRINLPGVGNNLQDHMLMHMGQGFNNQSYVYSNILQNATVSAAAQQLYYANRTGPWTFGPPDGNAFLSMPQFSNNSEAYADQAASQGAADYLAPGLDQSVIQGYEMMRRLLVPALRDPNRGGIEFLQSDDGGTQISNMRPLTRGTVHAQSLDPFVYPALDMRYASDPVDYQFMYDALRWNDLLFQQPAIQLMEPFQYAPGHAGTVQDYQTFMNQSLGTEYHPTGTAAMMPQDMGGVVDPNLLVYGTQNLRIVDASIQPLIPAAHMEAVVYAVAEKAADIIKAAQASNPPRTPTQPIDRTNCTLPATSRRDLPSLPRGPVKRQAPASNTADVDDAMPTMYGSYPNYDDTPSKNVPQGRDMPASKKMPEGASLDFGDKLVRGVQGQLGQLLHSLDSDLSDLGELLGFNNEPPKPC
ncbi:MAG: hypothetical protein Q9159_007488 [Coniocarpon cinnabarinum]